MSPPRSDALVIFGVSGDLAYKKIPPPLQAMSQHGHLDVPVVGVASSDCTLEQLRTPAPRFGVSRNPAKLSPSPRHLSLRLPELVVSPVR